MRICLFPAMLLLVSAINAGDQYAPANAEWNPVIEPFCVSGNLDRPLRDGEQLRLGGTVLPAHLHALPFKGCTSTLAKLLALPCDVFVGLHGWDFELT